MQDCIIVTGGAGFIGCASSRGLADINLPIVAIDNLVKQVHPSQERPKALPDYVELVRGDICSSDVWDEVLKRWKPKILIHLCAETGTGQSLTEAQLHTHTNVTGTAVMLDSLGRNGAEPEHIVLTSSRAVYGEGAWDADGVHFYPIRRTHDEMARRRWTPDLDGISAKPLPHCASTTVPHPSSVYGATKLAQENVLSAWAAARDTSVTTLRIQNAYGPGQSPTNPYTGIVNIFHRTARTGRAIEVYEDGEIGRDFVYIDDVAQALVSAAKKRIPGFVTVDVGTGARSTISQVANIIAEMHGAPTPVITGKFRDGDIRSAHADPSALNQLLGVHPQVGLLDGLRRVGEYLISMGYA